MTLAWQVYFYLLDSLPLLIGICTYIIYWPTKYLEASSRPTNEMTERRWSFFIAMFISRIHWGAWTVILTVEVPVYVNNPLWSSSCNILWVSSLTAQCPSFRIVLLTIFGLALQPRHLSSTLTTWCIGTSYIENDGANLIFKPSSNCCGIEKTLVDVTLSHTSHGGPRDVWWWIRVTYYSAAELRSVALTISSLVSMYVVYSLCIIKCTILVCSLH